MQQVASLNAAYVVVVPNITADADKVEDPRSRSVRPTRARERAVTCVVRNAQRKEKTKALERRDRTDKEEF
jgi:hypothetical protein